MFHEMSIVCSYTSSCFAPGCVWIPSFDLVFIIAFALSAFMCASRVLWNFWCFHKVSYSNSEIFISMMCYFITCCMHVHCDIHQHISIETTTPQQQCQRSPWIMWCLVLCDFCCLCLGTVNSIALPSDIRKHQLFCELPSCLLPAVVCSLQYRHCWSLHIIANH